MSLTRVPLKIIADLENYTQQKLISIIESKSTHQQMRHAAYLELVSKGDLRELQLLVAHMDFSYRDEFGNDAFRIAVIYGRIDVMQWLSQSQAEFKNIDDEERINIILHAVMNNRENVLEEFVKPREDGGFGWDLNVKHKNGFTPVSMALRERNNNLLLRLVASNREGGFGLQLEKSVLRKLKDHPAYAMYSGIAAPRYRRNKPGKRYSSVTLVAQESESGIPDIETYMPEKFIGKGAYGSVRLFASQNTPSKKLVVKQSMMTSADEKLSGYSIFVDAHEANHELDFLKRAYPDDGPYKLKHYVINGGAGYDYRMVMPFVPGKTIDKTVLEARSPAECAQLLLAIAIEMQRIHELGIVHGDARPGNIIIDTQKE